MKTHYIIAFVFVLCLTSCGDDSSVFFTSHYPSVDERTSTSLMNPSSEILTDSSAYRVYICSDTHVVDTHRNLSTFAGVFHSDPNAPVAICLGDLIHTGNSYSTFLVPFSYMQQENRGKYDTIYVALGNHDVFYDRYWEYIKVWKNTVYSFTIRCPKEDITDLYICLDTATGTLGSRQMQWLRKLLKDSENKNYRYKFVFTHVNLFRMENNYSDIAPLPIEEVYELMHLFSTHSVQQFWSGHDHARDHFTHGGVQYYLVSSMRDLDANPSYMVLDVSSDQLNNTFCDITTKN